MLNSSRGAIQTAMRNLSRQNSMHEILTWYVTRITPSKDEPIDKWLRTLRLPTI